MNNLLKDWDANRIIRLIVGIGFGAYAYISEESFFYWIAGFFLIQGILNFSFCSAAGCSSGRTQSKAVYEFKKYKPEK